MKVILDENLDHRLRRNLGSHEIFTSTYMGWNGLKNGTLIAAAEQAGFDLLLTGDKSLYHEQNLTGRKLAVITLSTVEWRVLKLHLPVITAAIDVCTPGSFHSVECGTFTRKITRIAKPLR